MKKFVIPHTCSNVEQNEHKEYRHKSDNTGNFEFSFPMFNFSVFQNDDSNQKSRKGSKNVRHVTDVSLIILCVSSDNRKYEIHNTIQ